MWEFPLIGLLAAQAVSGSPPQTDWRWQADREGCVLRQKLDDQGAELEIARTPGNNAIRMTLFDRRAAPRDWKLLKAVVISLDSGGGAVAEAFVGPGQEPRSRTVALSIADGNLLGPLSAASVLTLSGPKLDATKIAPRSMGSAIKALTECEDRKMRSWGVDPAAWRALTVKPTPKTPPTTWISWFDYPDRQKVYKNDIIVVARLDLAADGSVQNCTIVNSPPTEFREAACKALRRSARLQPARDASGQAIAAPFVLQVNFGAFSI